MYHILNGVGCFLFVFLVLFCSFFLLGLRWFTIVFVPLYIAILYLKVEVGLCNQQMYLTIQDAWCLWGQFPQ